MAAAGGGGRKGAKMAHFTLQGESGDMIIRKMTEKFGRNADKDADKDVRKRTYLVQEKQIREIYHYAPGRITSSTRTYLKEGVSGTVELTSVNPFAAAPKAAELDEDFRSVVALEKECNHSVREAQREAQEIMKKRRREEREVAIDKTIFETARLKSKEDATKEAKEEEEEKPEDSKVDYLTPFLQTCVNPREPTREEAIKADRECRKALKERLIERVNIIQRRLEEENAALQKRQSAFQRNRDHVQGADEEFEQFCAEAMFRIGILEQRLQRQEETVLAKFTELEAMLKNDPRLSVIYAAADDASPMGRLGRGK
uniref:Uncharacterized protein n=1 Tax=Bicosoecida sp. CB-2014 TaxID=1486930 RepID=A0A7S1C183_9STRA